MNARQSDGQVLLWVAVMLVVLLLFAGLAVDVGAGLSVRREMQNAADAGALAGAYELCYGNPGQAEAAARNMALRNGAEVPVDVLVDGNIVRVEAGVGANASLLGLLGVNEYDVRAKAAAACERSRSACALWPIAFPVSVWENTPCDTHIYVWDDPKILDVNCEEWQCEVEGADESDKFVTPGDRGWLDFRGIFEADVPGTCGSLGGAALIKALIEDGCAGKVLIPQCIPGEPGTISATEKPIKARIGDQVYIPLFESVGCDGGGYWVTDFGCAEVIDYHKNVYIYVTDPETGETPPYITPGPGTSSAKKFSLIEIKISCDNCDAACAAPSGNAAGEYGDVVGVGLIE